MKKIAAILFGTLFFFSCKESNSESNSNSIKIVVIGSSTAEGIGASHPDSSWVGRYRHFLQKSNPENKVINLAKGGYTTYHLLPTNSAPHEDRPIPDVRKNITAALSQKPDGIILNLPSNDSAKEWEPSEQLSNFKKITTPSEHQNIPIWVCTTQPRNFTNPNQIQSQLEVRDSILNYYGDYAVNFWEGTADSSGHIKTIVDSGDGIHLNDKGHRLLFERIREEISLLKLKTINRIPVVE